MKFLPLMLGCMVSFSSSVFASNQHVHPESSNPNSPQAKVNAKWSDDCEIEIINSSFTDVRVFGTFDDGVRLDPFVIYSFEAPHYISLYYYGYCHAGMDLDIDTLRGDHIFGGFVRPGYPLYITPFMSSHEKSQVSLSK